ncbi:MAG: 6-carboxytetrahydropterin synthase, partial [Bryobacteraceae bacterium]
LRGLLRGWAMFRVTRRYRFAASHRLHSARLSDDENQRLYGECNNPYGHGHNYEVEVSARGPLDASGRAIDTKRLDELVQRQVLEPFGHRNLNADVNSFARVVPTSRSEGGRP